MFQERCMPTSSFAPCVLALANVVKHRTSDCKPSFGSPPGRYLFSISGCDNPHIGKFSSFRRKALILVDGPWAEETNSSEKLSSVLGRYLTDLPEHHRYHRVSVAAEQTQGSGPSTVSDLDIEYMFDSTRTILIGSTDAVSCPCKTHASLSIPPG